MAENKSNVSSLEQAQEEKSRKILDEECRNLVAYINARREAGAPRPAVFLSLGAYFFGEMCFLVKQGQLALSIQAVDIATNLGRALFESASRKNEGVGSSLQPTQKPAAA